MKNSQEEKKTVRNECENVRGQMLPFLPQFLETPLGPFICVITLSYIFEPTCKPTAWSTTLRGKTAKFSLLRHRYFVVNVSLLLSCSGNVHFDRNYKPPDRYI